MTAQAQQEELLAAIGQKLKAAREAQGISIQDVAARTRIQGSFLEKIEQGDLTGLPGFSFLRGFINNYAQMLGVDEPELQEQLKAMSRAVDATPPPAMKSSTERLLDAERVASIPWPRIALLALLAILVLWVGYLLVRVFLPSDSAYEPPPARAPVAQAPAAPRAPSVAVSPAAPAPAPASGSSAPAAGFTATSSPVRVSEPPAAAPGRAAAGPTALRVRLQGLEDTWVRYAVDRHPPVEVLLRPAESTALDADEEVRLTIGKSQGVSVYLNGEEVVLPPQKNRLVADLVLNRLTVLKIRN